MSEKVCCLTTLIQFKYAFSWHTFVRICESQQLALYQSTKDGWWIRTTFIKPITSKVHLLDNFAYNHSVPTRTRTCHAQQNSFCCCHPPEYKRTHDFAHDQLRNVLSALFTNLYYRVLWKSVRSSISHGAYPT